ncbi:putative ribosomal protein L23 [Colletotrichum tofieldiae]|nr:putative ribosomal protein L23 [Colletotrichum tofieldiae]
MLDGEEGGVPGKRSPRSLQEQGPLHHLVPPPQDPRRLARAQVPSQVDPHEPRLDEHKVIVHPLNTESAMKKIEENNTLVFIVDVKSNKAQIKQALKKLYDIDTVKINTLIRPDGSKKAYARLTPTSMLLTSPPPSLLSFKRFHH